MLQHWLFPYLLTKNARGIFSLRISTKIIAKTATKAFAVSCLCQTKKKIFQNTFQGPICSSTFQNDAAQEMDQEKLINNDADPNVFSGDFNKNKADPSKILAIKAELRHSLLSIASKLLKSEDTRLHHLTSAEQQLWNSLKKLTSTNS